MPVEIEYKIIIQNNFTEDMLLDSLAGYPLKIENITQNYLSSGGRTRRKSSDNWDYYEFTYKDSLPTGGEFEINSEISKEDYDMSLQVTEKTFTKKRITFSTKSNTWEIDLFINEGRIYFALIESELPEINPSLLHIEELPLFLRKRIISIRDPFCKKFTSLKLADKNYALKEYSKLMQ